MGNIRSIINCSSYANIDLIKVLNMREDELRVILQSPFLIDSENSVYYLLWNWSLYDPSRIDSFHRLVDYIQFHNMTRDYREYVVPNTLKYIKNQDTKQKILNLVTYGAFVKIKRNFIPDHDYLIMALTFNHVNKWIIHGMYISYPVFANGYWFSCAIKPYIDLEHNTSGLHLYLFCGDSAETGIHSLPIQYAFVAGVGNNHRICIGRTILKSGIGICSRLTFDNESFTSIISGLSNLVHNNSIILSIGIHFIEFS